MSVYRSIMNQSATMYERVNITLPKGTLQLIDRVTRKKGRSGFVDRAVRFYVVEAAKGNLEKQLRAGAKARAKRDSAIAEAWFPLEGT